jgi:hypothetical protein
MTRELSLLVDTFHWTFADIQRVTINAMKSAFTTFDERVYFIKTLIKPAYREVLAMKHGSNPMLFKASSRSDRSSKLGLGYLAKRLLKDEGTSVGSSMANIVYGVTDNSDDGERLIIDDIAIMTAEEAEAMSDGGEEDEEVTGDEGDEADDIIMEAGRTDDLMI